VLYYTLLILLLTTVSLVGLLLMVKKYYWGPSGHPPKYRPHNGNLKERANDVQQNKGAAGK